MFVKAVCSVSSERKCGTCSLNDSKTPREMSGRCGNPWGKKQQKNKTDYRRHREERCITKATVKFHL